MIDRRELLGLVGGTGLIGLAASAAQARGQGPGAHPSEHAEHLATVVECARICNDTTRHCLAQLRRGSGDHEKHVHALDLAMDCQAFCTLVSTLMARSSTLAGYAHAACAEACRACAEACDGGDAAMTACAEACRKCEKVCREMAAHHGHEGHREHE